MKEIVAKRYAKSLVEEFELDDLKNISEILEALSVIVKDKALYIKVFAPDISKEDKESFILDAIKGAGSEKLNNFFKILVSNDRIDTIPYIADEIKSYIADATKTYSGIVYSSDDIDGSILSKLSEGLGKKFDSNIDLSYKKSDFDGIKVDVDGLGVEINFSKDRINKQIVEHILQAI